eukprot:5923674-Karenia_brevis.AAC.1
MTNRDNKPVHDRKGIADVFADFYESLYKHNGDNGTSTVNPLETPTANRIPSFTHSELDKALKQ